MMRLDETLLAQGLAKDAHEANGLIMAGRVFVANDRQDKPSFLVPEGTIISITPEKKYVSRGGFKLERALQLLPITLVGKTCIDVGSSTGGFTHCMLLNGAKQVYAVDVGYGLLDWSLRNDPRVTVLERINARKLQTTMFEAPCDFASIDVSFISLRHIFPALYPCLVAHGYAVALVKPQFEAARDQVGKGGIVRDPAVRGDVLRRIKGYAIQAGFTPIKVTPSPIRGADGNVEFLLILYKGDAC